MYCQKLNANRHESPDTKFCQRCKREGIERRECDLWEKEYISGKDLQNALERNCPRGEENRVRCRGGCKYYRVYASGESYYSDPYEFRRCEFTIEEYLRDILKFRLLPDAIPIIEKHKGKVNKDIDQYRENSKKMQKEKEQLIIQLTELRVQQKGKP